MPVKANGRNPSDKVGRLLTPGPPISRRLGTSFGVTVKRLRVLLSVQPLAASCRAWKPHQPDTPYYIIERPNWEREPAELNWWRQFFIEHWRQPESARKRTSVGICRHTQSLTPVACAPGSDRCRTTVHTDSDTCGGGQQVG